MTTDVTLIAQDRTDFGKGAARSLRRQGLVPAVMYGSGSPVRHIVLPAHETNLALRIAQVVLRVKVGDETLPVAPRDVQRDPVRTELLHLDLILLSKADVAERHAYNEAMEKAQANAVEAGLDPTQAAHVIEEAAAAGEDLDAAADAVVATLEAQTRALADASDAADAAEEAADAASAASDSASDAD